MLMASNTANGRFTDMLIRFVSIRSVSKKAACATTFDHRWIGRPPIRRLGMIWPDEKISLAAAPQLAKPQFDHLRARRQLARVALRIERELFDIVRS